jgi:hypothetical protein
VERDGELRLGDEALPTCELKAHTAQGDSQEVRTTFSICELRAGIVMIGAAISHASLKEPRPVAFNVVLLAICAFVAAGRLAALA